MKTMMLTLIFCMILLSVRSQEIYTEVTGVSGQTDTIGRFSVCWTVGECVVDHYCNTECMLSQGFHQTYYKILKIDEKHDPSLDINIYPNPAIDLLNIDLSNLSKRNTYRILLYNLKGEILFCEESFRADIIKIDLKNFQEGVMILKVIDLTDSMKASFKIIKVNR